MKRVLEMTVMARGTRPPDVHYHGIEDLVLEHGEEFSPRALPPPYRHGARRLCFENCYHLILAHPEVTYVEGFAMSGILGVPVHHAWGVDEQGGVVEVTWREPEVTPHTYWAYLGIRFPREIVFRSATYWGRHSVLYHHHAKFLLREPYSPERALAIYRGLEDTVNV